MTGDGAAPVPDSARGEAARPRDAGGGARDSIVPALYVDSSTVSFPPGNAGDRDPEPNFVPLTVRTTRT